MRLISARWVIPISVPPIREAAVVLGGPDERTIVAVGPRADLLREHGGLAETRADGALCPGLVNAHAHLELSAFAGKVPGGDGVANWTRRLSAMLAGQDSAAMATAAVQAATDAKAYGTAAFGDVGNGCAGWRALGRAGLGGVFFHELVGSREARTGDAMADAAAERARVPHADRPTGVDVVAAPHAPYSVGADLMRRIFAAAANAGRATTIHLAEDPDELQLLRHGTGAWSDVLRALGMEPAERAPGLGPMEYLERLGAFAMPPPPLLVHMVHADADDRRRARDVGATVVLCPRSNRHIGGKLADVSALIADGVSLAIGTDSLASTPDLSPWGEMATLVEHFPDIPPHIWLRAATQGGAYALGLPLLGSLAPGLRPGLLDVALSTDTDPERALVSNPHPSVNWMVNP